MFSPKKILVATDFSPESDNALTNAIDIAAKFNAEVYVLHVLDDIADCVADYCLPADHIAGAKKSLVDSASKKLQDEIKKANAGSVTVKEVTRFGDHIEEIIKEVEEKGIDLIVAGPHVKHKVWHVLISHLTEELVKKAKCKLLLVKK